MDPPPKIIGGDTRWAKRQTDKKKPTLRVRADVGFDFAFPFFSFSSVHHVTSPHPSDPIIGWERGNLHVHEYKVQYKWVCVSNISM